MTSVPRLVIFGCGYTGRAVAHLARSRGWAVVPNVRSSDRAAVLRDEGFPVLEGAALDVVSQAAVDTTTRVLVAFPPDGATDVALAPKLAAARSVVYLSTTGVYGAHRGRIDDATPISAEDAASPRVAKLLAAEEAYRKIGATVFRCAAIYGDDRGLHQRVVRGQHQIPGDGTSFTSRIHVADLAALVLAAGEAPRSLSAESDSGGRTFVIGDREPARQVEIARWICQMYNVPMPPHVDASSVHETLRADRQVDASRAWSTFALRPIYPTYREGMAPRS